MSGGFDKFKEKLKPFLILYIIFDIIVIGSLNYALCESENGKIVETFDKFMEALKNIYFFKGIFMDFIEFLKLSFYTLIGCLLLFLFWLFNHEENEYENIENGSSDWCKGSEAYKKLPDGSEVLNKKGGFILSRYHYLGTDLKKVKINKNILVVGRFRCW